ncbi:MAG: twin-arginine translocation signal domain-containing protein, partial [Anaerolineae bacterium]
MNQKICTDPSHAVSRRNFLKLSGAAMVTISLPAYLRRAAIPTTFVAQQANYPRQVIGKLTGLKAGEPLTFRYPWDHAAATNFLIMLNEPAGGGIGPGKNIVAFNYLCPHQGGPLGDGFLQDGYV